MIFKNHTHEECFKNFIIKDDIREGDVGREALFYLLAFNTNTTKHINKLYDFNKHMIKSDALNQGFQTGSSKKVTLLAFNLFNGYSEGEDTTPLNIFSIGKDMEYLLEAMRIRFVNL